MKGKKTNQEIHESKRREEEACLEEKQNIEETASGQDVTESRSEYDRLLLLVKKGNTQAFGEFYEKTRGQVYGYAYRMLQQAQDAEEVVQETYLKIWKEAASYESDGKANGLGIYHCKKLLLHEFKKTSEAFGGKF